MPDLLHPAAPVVTCAPTSPVPLPPHLELVLAEPDAPARAPWLGVPVLGDPYPRHLFAPEVAWHEPLPPVLRPERPYNPTSHAVQLGLLPSDCVPSQPVCPPCHGDCRQGRDCPARLAPARPEPRRSLANFRLVRRVALAALLVFGFAVVHSLFAIQRP